MSQDNKIDFEQTKTQINSIIICYYEFHSFSFIFLLITSISCNDSIKLKGFIKFCILFSIIIDFPAFNL